MAKNETTEAPAETATATEATADSRLIMIDVPAGHASGLSGKVARNEVMRALAKTGEWTRGEIAKEITTLQFPDGSKKVPYQIVYQATKNITETKMVQRETAEASPAPAATEAASE